MKNGRLPLILFLGFTVLTGCSDSTIEEIDTDSFGYDYYPLEIGRSYIYEVDSIVFRQGTGNEVLSDSSRTLVRELIADTLHDNTGALLYRIERYERPDEQSSWQIRKVFTAARNNTQALRTEDNLRFIKLVFPLRVGREWDGNIFLPGQVNFEGSSTTVDIFKGWEKYEVLAVGEPDTVAGQHYQEVAAIRQAAFDSGLELRSAVEKYAGNIGLIYREWRILDTQCNLCCGGFGPECLALSWEEKAEDGFILRQRLLRFE